MSVFSSPLVQVVRSIELALGLSVELSSSSNRSMQLEKKIGNIDLLQRIPTYKEARVIPGRSLNLRSPGTFYELTHTMHAQFR